MSLSSSLTFLAVKQDLQVGKYCRIVLASRSFICASSIVPPLITHTRAWKQMFRHCVTMNMFQNSCCACTNSTAIDVIPTEDRTGQDCVSVWTVDRICKKRVRTNNILLNCGHHRIHSEFLQGRYHASLGWSIHRHYIKCLIYNYRWENRPMMFQNITDRSNLKQVFILGKNERDLWQPYVSGIIVRWSWHAHFFPAVWDAAKNHKVNEIWNFTPRQINYLAWHGLSWYEFWVITSCGLMTPYVDRDLSQHPIR